MNDQITLEDLKAARDALESWLDAFGDDDEFAEEHERVARVMRKMTRSIRDIENGASIILSKPKKGDIQ